MSIRHRTHGERLTPSYSVTTDVIFIIGETIFIQGFAEQLALWQAGVLEGLTCVPWRSLASRSGDGQAHNSNKVNSKQQQLHPRS